MAELIMPQRRLLVPAHIADEMERVRQQSMGGRSLTPAEAVTELNRLEAEVARLEHSLGIAVTQLRQLALTRAWELRPDLFCAKRALA